MSPGGFDPFANQPSFGAPSQHSGVETHYGVHVLPNMAYGAANADSFPQSDFTGQHILPLRTSALRDQQQRSYPTVYQAQAAQFRHTPHPQHIDTDFISNIRSGNEGQGTSGVSPTDRPGGGGSSLAYGNEWGAYHDSPEQPHAMLNNGAPNQNGPECQSHPYLNGPSPGTSSSSIPSTGQEPSCNPWNAANPHHGDPAHQYSMNAFFPFAHEQPNFSDGLQAGCGGQTMPQMPVYPPGATAQHLAQQWAPQQSSISSNAQASPGQLQYVQSQYRHSMPDMPFMRPEQVGPLTQSRHSMPDISFSSGLHPDLRPTFIPRHPASQSQRLAPEQRFVPFNEDGRSRSNRRLKRELGLNIHEKRDVFLLRNREAAAKCRNKKKARDMNMSEQKKIIKASVDSLVLEREGLVSELMRLKEELLAHVAGHGCKTEDVNEWIAQSNSVEGRAKFSEMLRDPTDIPKINALRSRLQGSEPSSEEQAQFEQELEENTNAPVPAPAGGKRKRAPTDDVKKVAPKQRKRKMDLEEEPVEQPQESNQPLGDGFPDASVGLASPDMPSRFSASNLESEEQQGDDQPNEESSTDELQLHVRLPDAAS